jgi:hypothetical protein
MVDRPGILETIEVVEMGVLGADASWEPDSVEVSLAEAELATEAMVGEATDELVEYE